MKHSWEPLDKIWGASAILAFKDFVKNFISQLTFMKKSPFGLKPLGLALSYFLCLEFPQTPDCQTPASFSDAQNSLPSNTLSRDLHSNFFSSLHHAVVRFIACNKDMQMLYSCALDLKPVEAKRVHIQLWIQNADLSMLTYSQCTWECDLWWGVE